MRNLKRFAASLAATVFLPMSFNLSAQAPAPLRTVRAQLLKTLRTGSAKVGDPLYLRTSEAWQTPGCTLPEGTTLAGHIVSLAVSGSGPRKVVLSLQFGELSCTGDVSGTLLPVLVALEASNKVEDSDLKRLSSANLESSTIATMFSPPRPGVPSSSDTMLTSANTLSVVSTLGLQREESNLKTGEVAGLRGVKLELPSTTTSSSLVSPRQITLEGHNTTLVLALIAHVASNRDRPSVARKTNALSLPHPEPNPVADEPTEAEVCAASGCQQVYPSSVDGESHTTWSVSLQALGFQTRPERLLTALDTSATVHFLGDDQLLITFPLHVLIKRGKDEPAWAPQPRKVRAVVMSRADGRVLLIRDWTVLDLTGSYLWSFGPGRVLAHVGEELVAFGPDLVAEQRFALPGPLAFVSPAPGGDLTLLATLHEVHTPREHADLAKFLGPDQPIEERYDLTGLDKDLHPISSRVLYTQPTRPAIFHEGMITARQGRAGHWELDEIPWSGQKTVLSRLQSDCPVDVNSLPGDLLIARGCTSNQTSFTWYRVLNSKGATLLKGTLNRYELFHQATANDTGTLFALATSHSEDAINFAATVHASAFTNLSLNVYDPTTGKLRFATHTASGSPEQEPFALSPGGSTLAVLTSDMVRTYTLP